jgi:hypothetical protein
MEPERIMKSSWHFTSWTEAAIAGMILTPGFEG